MNHPMDSSSAVAESSAPSRLPKSIAVDHRALDHSLVRSVAWNAAADWGTQIFTWAAFLWVMRLLTPSDFGIAALALILMPYMGQITGFGLPRAVVALPRLTDDQLRQMNGFNAIAGMLCLLVAVIIAKPFAAYFRTPQMAPVFLVACISIVVGGFVGVPNALLAKELRFRLLSILGIGQTLLSSALVLVMALKGFGYWSLILGNMIPSLIRHAIVAAIKPCRLAWPRLSSIREPLRFGWHLSVSTIASYAYQRLDNVVAGRMLGQTALGFYGNAWELANVPLEKVASLVTTVLPSYLSIVQDDSAALRRYLYGLTEVVAMAAFPACVGLGLVARECVPLILGHKWDGMIPPLEVLSYYAAFRAVVALLPKVLTAVGSTRFVMWTDLLGVVLLPIAFSIGSRWGITGIAWGWVFAYPVFAVPLYYKTFRTIDARMRDYLRALLPSLTGMVFMIPSVVWVKSSLPAGQHLLTRLVLEVSTGVVSYTAALLLFHRERARMVLRMARRLLPGRSGIRGSLEFTKHSSG
jgi:teichuronic acid exporter